MSASAKMVDFTNVKDGGNFNKNRIPAGDYLAKITKVEDAQAKDETFQYLFTIQLVKRSGSKFPYYCKLVENQLWKLRNLLIAAGISVPKSKMKVDVNRLVNKVIGVTVDDTEYQDKEQSEITAVFPAAELQDGGTDDDDESEDADEASDDDLDDLDGDTSEAEEDEEEADEEAEEEADEAEEGDEWDAITDRLELRKALKKVAPDVKTSTSMTEDDIRDLIRKHSAKAAPKVAAKPAAKKKPAAVSDDELDSLDIDDL